MEYLWFGNREDSFYFQAKIVFAEASQVTVKVQ